MKFIDYNSPEKEIIKDKFKSIPYMDIWISSVVEGYIYKKVSLIDREGRGEVYTERYGSIEGECKAWYPDRNVWFISYYKGGNLEGETKEWHQNGQLKSQWYYKEGKVEGEVKK